MPDLYKGKLGVTVEEAHHLMDNLDWPGAKAELGEAIEYLKSTGATKVRCRPSCEGCISDGAAVMKYLIHVST